MVNVIIRRFHDQFTSYKADTAMEALQNFLKDMEIREELPVEWLDKGSILIYRDGVLFAHAWIIKE
jgi:hypothetical protein